MIRSWQVYTAAAGVLILSFVAAWMVPTDEFLRAILSIPGVAALVAALFQLVRDQAAQERALILQEIRHQNQLVIEQGTRRHQLRLAALERRLVAHQEAYTRWWQLRRLIMRDEGLKLFDFAYGCEEWWTQNCIFLEAEAREAFYKAIINAHVHGALIRDGSVSEGSKKESLAAIRRAGPLLVKAVELPVINADEETPSTLLDAPK